MTAKGTEEDNPPISLGIVTGGPGPAYEWAHYLAKAGIAIIRVRIGWQSPFNVNIVFHVAGEILGNEFSGMRTGKHSRIENTLMIQVAVDEAPGSDPMGQIEVWLHDAIDMACEFAHRKKLDVGELVELHQIVDEATKVWGQIEPPALQRPPA
jgi:hypothetical protein